MPAAAFTLVSTAVPQRLSDVYGGPAGAIDAAKDIPYRQLLLQGSAALTLGDTAGHAAAGIQVGPVATAMPLSLGPFDTGPLKLSEFWVVGVGTLSILGIPF